MQQIKGESSFWVNQQKLLPVKLRWQSDYYAVSVSESQVQKVRSYIENQKEHHKRKSFNEECDEFIQKYHFLLAEN